jgi:aspartate/methionine/tyrosine aminotransferase
MPIEDEPLVAALILEDWALAKALSPLGRRAGEPLPYPVPAAAAERAAAKGLAAPAGLGAALAGLAEADGALAAPPPEGLPELRRLWRRWQRRGVAPSVSSTLPFVTSGLAHGLSLVADLFGGEGRAVAVPEPFWGNYRQAFAVRQGARLLTAPAYTRSGEAGGAERFDPRALGRALAPLPPGETAVAVVNLPSNPGGYMPEAAERAALVASLVEAAGERPLVVVCDDAYAGLVYEPEVPRGSLFWELVGAHRNLVPVKVDGGTKEFSFFGGRVGFLTFGFEPGSFTAKIVESKLRALVEGTLGSAPATGQAVLIQALRQPGIEREVEAVRALLEGRYRALKAALAAVDPQLLRVLPFNAGCFALLEIPEGLGLTADAVRRHLLEHQDTGVIALGERYLRIAHCSVDAADLPELARRIERGVREMVR